MQPSNVEEISLEAQLQKRYVDIELVDANMVLYYILYDANMFAIICYIMLPCFDNVCFNKDILQEIVDANNISHITNDANMIQTNDMGKKQNVTVIYT